MSGDGLSPASRAEMTKPSLHTTADLFPLFQPDLPLSEQHKDLASALGVTVFDGPQGLGFLKGGHDGQTANTLICIEVCQRWQSKNRSGAGGGYVQNTVPQLPNFLASRVTTRFEETPQIQSAISCGARTTAVEEPGGRQGISELLRVPDRGSGTDGCRSAR